MKEFVDKWWIQQDSNLRPTGYEPVALTNWAMNPLVKAKNIKAKIKPIKTKIQAFKAKLTPPSKPKSKLNKQAHTKQSI